MLLRSVKDFEALKGPDALRPVERDLIEACRNGEPLILGDLPPEGPPDPTRHIRADLIRLLATGGTEKCGLHPVGIWLEGGHITGMLDLRFMKTRGRVVLDNCRFDQIPRMAQMECAQLSLEGSTLPGLFAQGIKVAGSLFLRNLTATGTVEVNGAKIGGQLSCTGTSLNGAGGMALNAQGVDCGEHLLLSNLTATGTVKVAGAKMGGQLSCIGATLNGAGGFALDAQGVDCEQDLFLRNLTATGTVHVNGAKIGGQLDCTGGTLNGAGGFALNAQSLHVSQGFLFRDLKSVTGQVYLDGAHVGDLVDDAASWPKGEGEVYLNGFTYARIAGPSPLTFAERKDWLARGASFKGRFHPQPYTQLAKVLREMGHSGHARNVLQERQKLLKARELWRGYLRTDGRYLFPLENPLKDLLFLWRWLTDLLLRWVVGYGYAPVRALIATVLLVGPAAILYHYAYAHGVIVPNSDVVMTSPGWWLAVFQSPDAPTLIWEHSRPARHYETFYGLAYAFDVFVPFVDLGQESAWSATTVNWPGWWTRIGTMALEMAGWIITALGLAAITGFIQKNQPD